MKAIKVSEASRMALDWLVAKCYYTDRRFEIMDATIGIRVLRDPVFDGSQPLHWFSFFPSESWAQGGPIIEREQIAIVPMAEGWEAQFEPTGDESLFLSYGPTPLIAAMRCYVASKLGDTAEVPDELARRSA